MLILERLCYANGVTVPKFELTNYCSCVHISGHNVIKNIIHVYIYTLICCLIRRQRSRNAHSRVSICIYMFKFTELECKHISIRSLYNSLSRMTVFEVHIIRVCYILNNIITKRLPREEYYATIGI
jgi:hypothetical protein